MRLAHSVSIAIATVAGLVSTVAHADLQDWQVNEIVTSAGGDPAVRYIELFNPVGGCFFPSTRIEVYGPDGVLLGAVAPVAATTCYGSGTYYLLATSAAVAAFDTTADFQMVPAVAQSAAQVCFSSSMSRYDCVRWGALSQPVVDLFGAQDTSVAAAPADGVALVRVDTTHIVALDWALQSPTPRGPNDGSPWTPPDAGPTPDARPLPDATAPADARPWPPGDDDAPDARVRADARNERFLDLDPVGGASCGCRAGGRHDGGWLGGGLGGWMLLAGLVLRLRWGRLRPGRLR